jgi:hypothetical protein
LCLATRWGPTTRAANARGCPAGAYIKNEIKKVLAPVETAVKDFADKAGAWGKAVSNFFSGGTEVFKLGSGEERKTGLAVTDKGGDSFTKETDKSYKVKEFKKEDLDVAKTAMNIGEIGSKNPNLSISGGDKGPNVLGATDGKITYVPKPKKTDTVQSRGDTYIIKTWYVGDDKYVDTTHRK